MASEATPVDKQQTSQKKQVKPKMMKKFEVDPGKAILERGIVTPFLELVDRDSNYCCYGIEDTMYAVEIGAAKTVIICHCFLVELIIVGKHFNALVTIDKDGSFLTSLSNTLGKRQLYNKEAEPFSDSHMKPVRLLNWLKNNTSKYSTELTQVEGHSEESSKFCNGFGVGGRNQVY